MPEGPPPPRLLAAERESGFFTWFHLEPTAGPKPVADGEWHRFQPSGDAFRKLAVLDVRVDQAGAIRAARLGLLRSFIHGPDNAFARDIAKSFLAWVLDPAAQQEARALIANIADLRTANRPLIVREMPPAPPRDASGGYGVFLGRADRAELRLATAALRLTNAARPIALAMPTSEVELLPRGEPAECLYIDVELR